MSATPGVVSLVAAAVLTLGACTREGSPPAPPATSESPEDAPPTERVVGPLSPADAQALATMDDRLKEYLDLHLKLERSLPTLPTEATQEIFHHPLYSSGDRHGSDLRLREVLEPLFLKYNVSVVLTGHDHFYERVKPQKGIAYFVVGSGGQLRRRNIDRGSGLTASGFDTDLTFMAAEITGDEMYFNVISRPGQIVDSGVLTRRKITP